MTAAIHTLPFPVTLTFRTVRLGKSQVRSERGELSRPPLTRLKHKSSLPRVSILNHFIDGAALRPCRL